MSRLPVNVGHAIRVAIVEDVEVVRVGLAQMVGSTTGFVCVGSFGDAESALTALPSLAADVLLMDIGLPGMNGVEATRALRVRLPSLQVMMLTVYEDEARIFDSLRAGAMGYVLKTTPESELLDAIRVLHQGGSPMTNRIARRVVEVFRAPPRESDAASELTVRERELLDLLAQGYRYKEIGEQLGIALDTVRTHIRHIYEKMQVRSRTEATSKYLRRG